MSGLDLDLSGAVESGGVIPAANYPVIVEKAEVAETRSGGQMIKIQLKIKDGPYSGRVIFDQFNFKNANPQAVQIGLGQLKGFMKAFGHPNPNKLGSTTELVGLKGIVSTKVVSDEQYGESTKVKGYKPLTATDGQPAATSAGATQPAANANPFA